MRIPFSKKTGEAKKSFPKKIKKAKSPKSSNPKAGDEKMIAAMKSILRPVVSEKSTQLAALNKYIFEVALQANRIEIRKGIEVLYDVHVEGVNTIPVKKRFVRHGKTSGWTKAQKKAIITLRKGDKIEVSKGV